MRHIRIDRFNTQYGNTTQLLSGVDCFLFHAIFCLEDARFIVYKDEREVIAIYVSTRDAACKGNQVKSKLVLLS
jgi:hypothetical protein